MLGNKWNVKCYLWWNVRIFHLKQYIQSLSYWYLTTLCPHLLSPTHINSLHLCIINLRSSELARYLIPLIHCRTCRPWSLLLVQYSTYYTACITLQLTCRCLWCRHLWWGWHHTSPELDHGGTGWDDGGEGSDDVDTGHDDEGDDSAAADLATVEEEKGNVERKSWHGVK